LYLPVLVATSNFKTCWIYSFCFTQVVTEPTHTSSNGNQMLIDRPCSAFWCFPANWVQQCASSQQLWPLFKWDKTGSLEFSTTSCKTEIWVSNYDFDKAGKLIDSVNSFYV